MIWPHCGKETDQPSLALTVAGEKRAAVTRRARERRVVDAAYHHAAGIIFTFWRDRLGKSERTWLDSKRLSRLVTRLRENSGNVSELLYAIDGALKDDRLMGRREDSDRKYDGIETVFRDRGQVERLVELSGWDGKSVHPLLGE